MDVIRDKKTLIGYILFISEIILGLIYFIVCNNIVRVIVMLLLMGNLCYLLFGLSHEKIQKHLYIMIYVFVAFPFASLLVIVNDYQYFDSWILFPDIIISAIYTITFFLIARKGEKRNWSVTLTTVFIASLMMFSIVLNVINVEFDYDNNMIEKSKIITKGYISSYGKIYNEYEFYFQCELDGNKDILVNVPYEEYKKLKNNDTVKVVIGNGLLNQRYYYYENAKYVNNYKRWEIIANEEDDFYKFLENENELL